MQPLTYTTLKASTTEELIASIDEHLAVGSDARVQLLAQELSSRKQEKQLSLLTMLTYVMLGFLLVITVISTANLQSDHKGGGGKGKSQRHDHR